MAAPSAAREGTDRNAAPLDRTALRFNQGVIVALLAVAFVLNLPWVVVFVAAVMALGTAAPSLALFQRLYRDVLRPAGLLKPDVHVEEAAPHRFAQGMGAGVLALAVAALAIGSPALGWGLTLLVIVLAAVNLLFGFCAGCFIFYQLRRLRGA